MSAISNRIGHESKSAGRGPRTGREASRAADCRVATKVVSYAALAVLCGLGLSLTGHGAYDLFWQIRCGNDILAHAAPPHYDTYSWTRQGAPWNVNEWLDFVLFSLAYKAAGNFVGPFLLMEALVAIIALTLYSALWRATRRPLVALYLSIVTLTAMSAWLQPRPFLFSFLFAAISTAVAACVLEGRSRPAWLIVIPPLFALWANLHQGVVAGVAVLGLLGLSAVAQGLWLSGDKSAEESAQTLRRGLQTLGASLLGLLATLVTPYGTGLYKDIWLTIRDPRVMGSVFEWQPLRLGLSLADGCAVLLFAGVAAAIVRYWKQNVVSPGYVVCFLAISVESVLHRRNLPLAVVIATVLFAPLLSRLVDDIGKWVRTHESRSSNAAVLPLTRIAAAVPIAYTLLTFIVHSFSIAQSPVFADASGPLENVADTVFGMDAFPREATSFMNFCGFPDGLRLYNDYDIGGMLIMYRPTDRVFIDGRADVYAGPLLDREIAMTGRWVAHQPPTVDDGRFLDSYDFDCAVVQNPLAAYYFATRPDYALVYVHHVAPMFEKGDSNCWIFVRRRLQFAALITSSTRIWAAHHQGQQPVPGI